MTPTPSKDGKGNSENDIGEVGKRGRRIALIQRKVRNLGNLGKTTGYIHRAPLVKSVRVYNLGGVTYKKVDERGRLHITVLTKGKEGKWGGGEKESRIIEVDKIVVCAGQDPKNNLKITARGVGGRGRGGETVR